MTLQTPRSIHSGQVGAAHKDPIMSEHFEKNDEKMSDPKSIQDQSGDVPVPPGHQKTCLNIK